MHKSNFALKKRAMTLDSRVLAEKLLEKLNKSENFTLKCNSEVNAFNYKTSTGQVSSVSIMGKIGKEVPADAVILCTGAHTAQTLYNSLGLHAPIAPVKSYTFDIPTSSEFTNTHLFFEEDALTAVFLKPGLWRMSVFGDLAGFNLDLDNRRARMA